PQSRSRTARSSSVQIRTSIGSPRATRSRQYDRQTMVKNKAVGLVLTGLIGLASVACYAPVGSTTQAAGPSQTIAGLPSASAEDVGMSGERLGRLAGAMEQLVDERRLAGVTTAIARHGKIAFFGTFGQRDVEAGAPMSPDAIFRIY